MADDLRSAAELLLMNNKNLADIEVSNILNDAPVLRALKWTTASNGTVHTYEREIGAPVVGFRAANAGRFHDVPDYDYPVITLQILDAAHHEDKKIAESYTKGGVPAYMAKKTSAHLRAAFFALEMQIFQGTAADAGGFEGLPDSDQLDALADAMVVGNGGSSACTSVWMIRTSPNEDACNVVMGQDGNIDVPPYFLQMILDGNSKWFPAYVQPVDAYAGLQIAGAYDVGRLANVGTAEGTTLDDAALGGLWDLFPSNRKPNLIAMTRRSLGQLRDSRRTDLNKVVPTPTDWEGIPIITTEAISNAETAVT